MALLHSPMRRHMINRDQTWFSMHLHLPGPEGSVKNRRQRLRFLTLPEGPGKC